MEVHCTATRRKRCGRCCLTSRSKQPELGAEDRGRDFASEAIREAQARGHGQTAQPRVRVWELNPRIPERAIFTVDTGSAAAWYARYLDLRAGMMGSLSGNLATMGPAMPYAIAAKFAYPDRPVFALAATARCR